MGYISSNLLPEEKIIYQAKLHWIIFLWPCIFLLALVIPPLVMEDLTLYFAISWFLLPVFIILTLISLTRYLTTEMAVTNKRVLIKRGLIKRDIFETFLNKVESVNVSQGILGRLLGYGTVIISGTGGSQGIFREISDPLVFRRVLHHQLESAR